MVIQLREIGPVMAAAAFGTKLRAARHELRDFQHVFDLYRSLDLERRIRMQSAEALTQLIQVRKATIEPLLGPKRPGVLPHRRLNAITQRCSITFKSGGPAPACDLSNSFLDEGAVERQRRSSM